MDLRTRNGFNETKRIYGHETDLREQNGFNKQNGFNNQ